MSILHEVAAQEWDAEKRASVRQGHLPTKSTQRRARAAVSKTGVDLSGPCTRRTGITGWPVVPFDVLPSVFHGPP